MYFTQLIELDLLNNKYMLIKKLLFPPSYYNFRPKFFNIDQ